MEPSAKSTVALSSRNQAELYFQSGNVGRAFAHFLVSLTLKPEWKDELKENFSSALCEWGNELEGKQRYKDLFDCYEQAIEIFPENEEIICNLGAHLFRLGHKREAAHYFHRALDINNNYLPAFRNLQNLCNSLMEQWHFRMLNDSHRNEAYREAIVKKVRQGFSSVLDIGTGTGLLSMYAVAGGASDVHACDYSSTMCAIAQDVLSANKMTDDVVLINKLSNHLKVPEDFPQRKSLVVTETMDCGLLGEHLLQTLIHAWDKLLKPVCPQSQLLDAIDSETPLKDFGLVVPFGASLWAAPIRSPTLARRYYLTNPESSHWRIGNIWLYSDSSELYDTEDLKNMKDCIFLDSAVEIFTFDFNNPTQLKAFYEGSNDDRWFSFQFEGKADALAVWFDIILDEDIVISSSPFKSHNKCCWDQAIFHFKTPQDSFKMRAKCRGGKLNFEVIPNVTECADELCSTSNNSILHPAIGVSSEIISFINNKELQDVLITLPQHFDYVETVLDLSPFPLLGLRFLQLKDVNLVCVLKSEKEVIALKEFMKVNNLQFEKVKCLMKNEFDNILSSNSEHFDFIMNNVFDTTGELSDTYINSIPNLMNILTPKGVLAPVSLTVMCQLVDSEWFSRTSSVMDEESIQTYKIAEFINLYKVSQQFNVELRNVCFNSLTEVTAALQLESIDLVSECRVDEISVPVTSDGCINAIPVWFTYQLYNHGSLLSTFNETSHINQMVFIVDPPIPVKSGECITLHITYHCGTLRIKVLR